MDNKACVVYIANTGNVNEDNLIEKYGSHFSKDRLDRINKKPCEKTRKELICAGAVLAKALLNEGIDSNEFIYKENKKPYLKGDKEVFFNISHSGDYVGVAVAHSEVGFDIQKPVENVGDATKKRVLSRSEQDLLNHAAISFNEIWTVKESYSKLTGEGIAINFTDITYKKDKTDSSFTIYRNEKESAKGKIMDLPGGYKASVCSKVKFKDINVVLLDL